jgi:hypothetical protein
LKLLLSFAVALEYQIWMAAFASFLGAGGHLRDVLDQLRSSAESLLRCTFARINSLQLKAAALFNRCLRSNLSERLQ